MSNSQPVARNVPKRDPVRMKTGKVVFEGVLETRTLDRVPAEEITSAIYYLDAQLFLPTGGKKVERMLRDEAKRLGVL